MKAPKQCQKHRMTRQRRVILEELRKMNSHPSAEEVYEVVRQHLPRISLGTVYRNLDLLSETGEIQVLDFGGKQKRFDHDTQKHYHIRCINCDRVENAPFGVMTGVEHELDGATGYKVMSHQLEFRGLCPVCMEKAMERESLDSNIKTDASPYPDKASNF